MRLIGIFNFLKFILVCALLFGVYLLAVYFEWITAPMWIEEIAIFVFGSFIAYRSCSKACLSKPKQKWESWEQTVDDLGLDEGDDTNLDGGDDSTLGDIAEGMLGGGYT